MRCDMVLGGVLFLLTYVERRPTSGVPYTTIPSPIYAAWLCFGERFATAPVFLDYGASDVGSPD